MALFHVWFSTKRRKPALVEETRETVLREFKEIATRNSIDLIEVEAQWDHVHLLLRLNDQQTLSESMRHLKGAVSRQVFLRHPDLRYDMGTFFWQRGYGFRGVQENEAETVRRYIQTQENRPLRHG